MCIAFQSLSIKRRRKIIASFYHLGVVAVSLIGIKAGTILNSYSLLNVSASFLLGHILTFRIIPISRWIQEKLIQEAICFGCGAVIELVSLYRCGCGYSHYKERHVFSPCPMCGKYFLWITCPECETSIPI